ncbi:MAG: serine hydrolase [Gemmatimonadales bacterium]|jgi:CubicO group peptidase (beta-lactamase class C family)
MRFVPLPRAAGLLVSLVSWLSAPAQVTAQNPLAGLDGYVQDVMRDWEAPGVAVAVVKNDRVVYARGFGVRRVGGSDPVDEHTVFAIASTSKAFTAAALGMLVDAGRLQWDDRVTDHLVGFQLHDPWVTRELTVRDLLSHRSGLPRGDRLWYLSPFERDEVLRRVRALEPARSFRAAYGYQNIMFTAAGEVVAAVTDTSWGDFVAARIFAPLGMRSSTTTTDGIEQRPNVATPHGKINGHVTPIPWRDWDNLGGAGAINSSVADLAQWMRLQLGEGTYDGRRIVSDSVIAEMHTPQTIVPRSDDERELFPESHFAAYGLGWRLMDYRGRMVVRHGGALDGMRTHVLLVPEEGLGVVAVTNVNESSVPQAIVWYVVDRYLDAPAKDWNALFLAEAEEGRARRDSARAHVEAERLAGTSPTHALEAFAGTYEHELHGTATVTLEDGALRIAVGPAFQGDMEHWHLNTFRITWRDPYLGRDFAGFELDRMGRIVAVDVEGFGRFVRRVGESP